MKALTCGLLGLVWLLATNVAWAAPTMPIPLMQALKQVPPASSPLPTSSASSASGSSTKTCAPMCIVPMKGQTPQQAINAIEQAGHCTITQPPGSCKPATAASWSTMHFSTQGLQTLERLEGWSNQDNPKLGEIPGVCYDDGGAGKGNGTVGYGHMYSSGHTCLWLMQNPNTKAGAQYYFYKQHPLTQSTQITSDAVKLLEHDVQTKAIHPIEQQINVQLTQQQFDALVIWTFNVGGGNYSNPKISVADRGGLAASQALTDMNACNMSSVPSDFTHYDHVHGVVSCGSYRRDMVSGEIWIAGAYAVPRSAFPCPAGSVK